MGLAERAFVIELPDGLDAPATQHALSDDVAALLIAAWRELASENVDTGDYLARLTMQDALNYPYAGNPDAVAVVNTAAYAEYLEYGRAGFHLPSVITHWKLGANGGRYLHIPFRHGTPIAAGGGFSTGRRRQEMPREVYGLARQLQHRDRLAGFGSLYKRSKAYSVARRLDSGFPARLQSVPGYTWKASKYEGLFNGGMKETPGGGTQSSFMTIRTITPESEGWYIPPTPAHNFATRALDQIEPDVQALLAEAAATDLGAAMEQAIEGLV